MVIFFIHLKYNYLLDTISFGVYLSSVAAADLSKLVFISFIRFTLNYPCTL
ncbi:hypothetical protein M101_2263 [Bacteroides fragilis str. 1007-1-F |nr:hypothetical protein M101_2263 [Bacteroides fragilis str. 1007-1-F \